MTQFSRNTLCFSASAITGDVYQLEGGVWATAISPSVSNASTDRSKSCAQVVAALSDQRVHKCVQTMLYTCTLLGTSWFRPAAASAAFSDAARCLTAAACARWVLSLTGGSCTAWCGACCAAQGSTCCGAAVVAFVERQRCWCHAQAVIAPRHALATRCTLIAVQRRTALATTTALAIMKPQIGYLQQMQLFKAKKKRSSLSRFCVG